jgi:hypothetical protein
MKKYLIVALAAFTIEVASTMYISTVADKSVAMIFWAFVGPFLGLPFIAYQIEAKNWNDRIILALVSGVGYSLGALLVYLICILKL